MQQVTATAGEVVVPKVPEIPKFKECWRVETQYFDRSSRTFFQVMGIPYENPERAKEDGDRQGHPYRIVRIPGEEVKDAK